MSTEPRKTDEKFTGYMIWDDGVLYQQWEYILREWDANALRWIATKDTEWRKVPAKSPALANVAMSHAAKTILTHTGHASALGSGRWLGGRLFFARKEKALCA